MAAETMHLGKKISRIRELKSMKQETLASLLGVSQQAVSKLEQSEHIEDHRLEEIGKALGVSAEAIKKFNEEAIINVIGNTVTTVNDNATGQLFQFNPVINPIEKWVEALEENKKLYERLLEAEREKNELLRKMLEQK